MAFVCILLCGEIQLLLLFMEETKMAKAKTSKKQKKSETKSLKVHEPFVSPELKDSKVVVEALLECLREGDVESFREVLTAHLMTTNKSLIAKKAKLGRRTLYDLMDPTKKFNPELSTVSAIIHALAA